VPHAEEERVLGGLNALPEIPDVVPCRLAQEGIGEAVAERLVPPELGNEWHGGGDHARSITADPDLAG